MAPLILQSLLLHTAAHTAYECPEAVDKKIVDVKIQLQSIPVSKLSPPIKRIKVKARCKTITQCHASSTAHADVVTLSQYITSQKPQHHSTHLMITKKVIDELYRKYRRRPDSIDSLDIPLLFEHASDHHDLQIDADGNLIIGSIDERSPFREIALRNVNGITHFDDTLAIVLHSSILFLNKHDEGVNVHIRTEQPSIWERLRWKLCNA